MLSWLNHEQRLKSEQKQGDKGVGYVLQFFSGRAALVDE